MHKDQTNCTGTNRGGTSSESTKKDILEPLSNNQVSSFSSVNWSSNGGTFEVLEKSYAFNLKDFLPKGSKDPKRNIATIGYADSTITTANGLTNFQKVTRMLNEKRSELMP